MNINIKAYLIKCTIMLLLIVWCDCVDPIELPSEHECIIVCPPPLRIQLLPSTPEGPQKWSRVVKLVEGVCAVVANTRLPRASCDPQCDNVTVCTRTRFFGHIYKLSF